MSVINQMLKDLDQRQGDEPINNERQHMVATQQPSKKIWLFIVLSVVLINVFVLVIWWQYQENQQLKAQQNTTPTTQAESKQVEHQVKVPATRIKQPSPQQSIETERQSAVTVPPEKSVESADSHISEKQDENQHPVLTTQQDVSSNKSDEHIQRHQATKTNNTVKPQDNDATQQHVSSQTNSKPTLSIARKQLTPKELVAQKSNAAQQAIDQNDIKQAEKLLEEILLIQPSHHSSRKQLAALWFGRQDYRAALNVLFQGIALAPQNPDFRIMQARIYMKQGMLSNAINTLLPLATVDNVEFQSLLASLTQQVGDHKKAAAAYLRLTQLQPAQGKWWLGYAVALDSQGEFNLAKSAYRQTQQTNDISESTRQFIRQRLTELGE
ncbi:tetratricopeptide repeat protein [Thalassotalea sp. 1_MG-2023]|uniref:tetratricopeptide repeat protein n=1 Tax=Thalassotalea sp. 1_MG-2023 TaxID=3062680 RepID=UPI0026E2D40A|nr:tetratricopeptide repeat protein [Thalassotalea sp. 1_MG-2023]MDO6426292.1 tetratricopeptide repeat protein [Thalassotalea sp. 1_MG-2023]